MNKEKGPIPILHRSIELDSSTSKLYCNYFHEEIRVFFFSSDAEDGFKVNLLNSKSLEIVGVEIDKESQLHRTLS